MAGTAHDARSPHRYPGVPVGLRHGALLLARIITIDSGPYQRRRSLQAGRLRMAAPPVSIWAATRRGFILRGFLRNIMAKSLFLVAFVVSSVSTAFAPTAFAKGAMWYSQRSCQFSPGGGRRAPAEIAACRRQAFQQGPRRHLCKDWQQRGPVICGSNG
jgi:hypothetical protein